MKDRRSEHLAEFNIGILRYDWDDPRVADFVDNLDLVNNLAARSPGFVWRMSDADMDGAQNDAGGVLDGNPRTASTLSVWDSAGALEHFVWNTVHKRFFDRRHEWFAPGEHAGPRLVMWWVAQGHRPTIAEAKARLDHLAEQGESDHAFGWAHLRAHRNGAAA